MLINTSINMSKKLSLILISISSFRWRHILSQPTDNNQQSNQLFTHRCHHILYIYLPIITSFVLSNMLQLPRKKIQNLRNPVLLVQEQVRDFQIFHFFFLKPHIQQPFGDEAEDAPVVF